MPAPPAASQGFVYVATGERYRQEALLSAASVRAWHPGARICLVTDRAEGPEFWDDLVLLERPTFGFRDKIAMHLCPYERFIFLDADTKLLGDLAEVFQLLDRFDFAGHQLFEGHDRPLPGVPDAFPEFNGGVLAFRRSPAVESFFTGWSANYDSFLAENRDGHYDYSNVSDQKSLRLTLYRSPLSVSVLGPEFNFVPAHVNFACASVRILHGRGPLDDLATRLNRRLGNRAYLPRFDAVIMDHAEAAELLRLWRAASLQLLRLAGRHLTPLKLRNWLRRSARIRALFLTNRFAPPDGELERRKWRRPPPR